MTAVICLSILSLALLGAIVYLHLAHARERQDLLDRIQAPEVTHAAAIQRHLAPPPPTVLPEDPRVPVRDYDLALDGLIKD